MRQPITLSDDPQPEQQRIMGPPSIAVTVVVPMRNEERRIGPCLDSITRNEFPPEQLEILVVDGRSTDSSCAIVAERAARFASIRLLDNPAKIVSAGLNIGLREARGRVIIIMGAHAEYSPTYIKTCLQELEATNADAVGGVLQTLPGGHTLVARAVALMTQHPFGVGGSAFRTRRRSGYVDTVPYAAYRRPVFERVGLFNEKLVRNQDFEFNARVRRAGGKLFLSSQIETTYYQVPDLKHLVMQAFNNGFWLAQMWFSSPASIRLRHAVPGAFVGVLLASLMLLPLGAAFFIPGALALVLYGIAVTLTAGQIARYEGGKFFLPLCALFFAHHVVYGAGTLAGLISCATRPPYFQGVCESRTSSSLRS
jgi:succinoglycan biosynthesis protein ExoA